MTPIRRRLVPRPVNTTAMTSMALRKLLTEQEMLLRKARRAKANRTKMRRVIETMIANLYRNALMRQRPVASAYIVRSAIPRGKNLRGPNLRRRLFGNSNKNTP